MKRPKKMTRTQKECLSRKGFNPKDYQYIEEDGIAWRFVHKETNEKYGSKRNEERGMKNESIIVARSIGEFLRY